jgi:copper(I)-binding protein
VNCFVVPLVRLFQPLSRRVRLSTPVAALAAGGLIGAVALTGCGSGQLSQTASQASAVDGNQAVINNVALRNVHIQAVQTGDFLRPGAKVDLMLVAVNQSSDITDRLVGITTDIGTVTVTGDPRLPAGGVLFVGTPDGQNRKAVTAVEAADTTKASVQLAKPITNGLNYDFTFNFEKAGSISLAVPISAGLAPRQNEAPAPAEHQ